MSIYVIKRFSWVSHHTWVTDWHQRPGQVWFRISCDWCFVVNWFLFLRSFDWLVESFDSIYQKYFMSLGRKTKRSSCTCLKRSRFNPQFNVVVYSADSHDQLVSSEVGVPVVTNLTLGPVQVDVTVILCIGLLRHSDHYSNNRSNRFIWNRTLRHV